MEQAIFWGTLGVLFVFLIVGLLAGLIRGLKRSSLHLLFLVCSILLAFFITKPITSAILGVKLPLGDTSQTVSQFVLSEIQKSFNISSLPTAQSLVEKLPTAIVSPILFILVTLLTFLLFDIIYLIVARVSFGKKKTDFENHKPLRVYGGLIGLFEGFLFMFVLFAPLSSLTHTYAELSNSNTAAAASEVEMDLKPISSLIDENIPKEVDNILDAYNKSVLGKIAGFGGLDNAMFDGLSSFKINGEKVKFRQEVVHLAKIYDDVCEIYQNINNKTYDEVELSGLKVKVKQFTSSGLFKGVICEIAKEYVVNTEFEETNQFYNLLQDFKQTFSRPKFNLAAYLKNDLVSIIDAADAVFDSGIIKEYQQLSDKSVENILKLVSGKGDELKVVASDILNLKLVDEHLSTVVEMASDKISDALSDKIDGKIELNSNITDKDAMLESLNKALTDFLELNDLVNIFELAKADDVVGSLYEIEDIDTTFNKFGEVFDTLREMELLVVEKDGEKEYQFDKILKSLGLELLGDEVTSAEGQKVKLDTYTAFFNHIKTPVKNAKSLGLNNLDDFDAILDAILAQDENFLAETIMPFYELSAMNINEMVFDKVINEIDSNLEQVDFSKVEKTYEGWQKELQMFGKILNVKDEQGVAYVKHLVDGTDMQSLLKNILKDDKVEALLTPIFNAASFKPLLGDLFGEIDSLIEKATGSNPQTPYETAAESDIAAIKSLLNIILDDNVEMENLDIAKIGEILDVLRINAYNNGQEDKGIFNNVFATLIYYITSDTIIDNVEYAGQPMENAKEVQKLLKVNLSENPNGYYELDFSVLSLVDALVKNDVGSGTTVTEEQISGFVDNLKSAVDSVDKSEDELVKDIENLKDIVGQDGLATFDDSLKEDIQSALESKFGPESPVADALADLLGLK